MTNGNQYYRRGKVGILVGCVLLLAVATGCASDGLTAASDFSGPLGEFIVSFARSAAAAWPL